MADPEELLKELQKLKTLMTFFSTGQGGDTEEYNALRRKVLLPDPILKEKLPACVLNYRNLGEFWNFIQPKFARYAERREYLAQQFEPAFTYLESLTDKPPVTATATPILTEVNSIHVQDAWNKAIERRVTDPEGAITAARTLLEAVCKHILDETDQPYDNNDDLPDLYKKVATQLNLAPSQQEAPIFKQILGGVNSVVSGLGSLRNKLGDAHGKGKVSVKPSQRHAQLAVNLAGSVATFLIETWEARSSK